MTVYDLIIIGSGAAGATAASTAVHLGASRVAMVEGETLWGTCVNVGCIPSKFLLALADYHFYKNHNHEGIRVDSSFDLSLVLAEKEAFISRLVQKKADHLLTRLGVELIRGKAEFVSDRELRIGDRRVTSDRFIIATGSSPAIPPVEGITSVPFMTNREALSPQRVPRSLIIIGGRSLGLEFAQLYAHLGTKVTLLQRSSRIIPEEEPEIAVLMTAYLAEEGIDIRTGVDIRKVEKTDDTVTVTIIFNGEEQKISAERLLLATGRLPNSAELHPERAGVHIGKNGAVIVDKTLKTTAPHIWAAGDVTGEPMLETAARYGGEIAAVNAVSAMNRQFDPTELPRGIFTSPQVASVGMTEEQAHRAGHPTICRCIFMNTMSRTEMIGDTRGIVKIVADKDDERILGVHICSSIATEIIQQGYFAVKNRLNIQDLIDTYYVFPALSEVISVCARAFRQDDKGACFFPKKQ
ncbi:MAG: mercury(II) reductase [Methanoregula sp.]